MDLGGKKRCSKGYRRNKNKTVDNPFDCIKTDGVKKRCPNGTHKTKKGCVKNTSARNARNARNARTRKRSDSRQSLRTYPKFYILTSTAENFKSFIQELTDDPVEANVHVKIPLAHMKLLIDKIEDELDKGGEHIEVKIDRNDKIVFDNTKVGRKWQEHIHYKVVPRGSTPRSPRVPRLPRERNLQDPNSLGVYAKFYTMKGNTEILKQFIKDLKQKPYPKNPHVFPGILTKTNVYILIKKIQKEINKKKEEIEVKLDRDDMFVIMNTEPGYDLWLNRDEIKFTGIKRSARS